MVLSRLDFTKLSDDLYFGIRIDMIDVATRRIIDFGKLLELLPALADSGIKFVELGNLNSFDYSTGRIISIFGKEPRLIPPEYFKQNFLIESEEISIAQVRQTLHNLISNGGSVFLPELIDFEKSNSAWLQNYACFSALSQYIGNVKFNEWPIEIRQYDRTAIRAIREQLADKILAEKILQCLVYEACRKFIKSAHRLGIYVSADLEPLCDEYCCETWSHSALFYLNQDSVPNVYLGLPPSKSLPHGNKSSNVPYRWQELYNSHFDFFKMLFSHYESDFDYIHMLHGYSFFHYWEISRLEKDPKYGRWVPNKFDLFFGYLHENFNKIPYVFDFNEPLFPKLELSLKRCALPQSVIFGEPTEHICEDYDLSRPVQMVCSELCNKKFEITSDKRSLILKKSYGNFKKILKNEINIKIIHFDEICSILGISKEAFIAQPQKYAKSLKNLFKKPVSNKTSLSKRGKAPIIAKITSIFNKRYTNSSKTIE